MKENSIPTVLTSTRSACRTYESTGMPSRPMTTAAMPPSTLSTTFLSVSANKVSPQSSRYDETRRRCQRARGYLLHRRADEPAVGGRAAVDDAILIDVAGISLGRAG